MNSGSRREETPAKSREMKFEPPHVGCYKVQGAMRELARLHCFNGSFTTPAYLYY